MKKTYEYTTITQLDKHAANDAALTLMAAKGWRLVHTGHTYFRLEREKPVEGVL